MGRNHPLAKKPFVAVEPKSDQPYVVSHLAEDLETQLRRVVKGEFYLLPQFVFGLMHYLNEGTDERSDAVAFSKNIGLKGAHILYVLQDICRQEASSSSSIKGESCPTISSSSAPKQLTNVNSSAEHDDGKEPGTASDISNEPDASDLPESTNDVSSNEVGDAFSFDAWSSDAKCVVCLISGALYNYRPWTMLVVGVWLACLACRLLRLEYIQRKMQVYIDLAVIATIAHIHVDTFIPSWLALTAIVGHTAAYLVAVRLL